MSAIRLLVSAPTKRDANATERVELVDAQLEHLENFISASSYCSSKEEADEMEKAYNHLRDRINAELKNVRVAGEVTVKLNKDGKSWTVFMNRKQKTDYCETSVLDGIVSRLATATK